MCVRDGAVPQIIHRLPIIPQPSRRTVARLGVHTTLRYAQDIYRLPFRQIYKKAQVSPNLCLFRKEIMKSEGTNP